MTTEYSPREFVPSYNHHGILSHISQLKLKLQLRPNAEVFQIFEKYPTAEVRRACLKMMEQLWLLREAPLDWMCDWAENAIRQLNVGDAFQRELDHTVSDLLKWYVCQSYGTQRIRAINFVLTEMYFEHSGLGGKQVAAALKNTDRVSGDIKAQTYDQIPQFELYVLEELSQIFKAQYNKDAPRSCVYNDSDWHRTERGINVMLSYGQVAWKLLPTFIDRLQQHLAYAEHYSLRPLRYDADQAYMPEIKAALHLATLRETLRLLITARDRRAQDVL
ncbi:MAG: hypothetical protein KBB55_02390 [Candidatus Buchananbacteria bacterium]|nr:hypothetical protein [Candidatus Buchananbacteria bacterium]